MASNYDKSDVNKLTNTEGQGIIRVIQECIDAARFLSFVNGSLLEHRETLLQVVGEEYFSQIENHLHIIGTYNDTLSQVSSMKSKDMLDISLKLEDNSLIMARLSKKHPEIVDKLFALAQDSDDRPLRDLINTMEGLRRLSFQKLVTTREDEKSQADDMREIESQENEAVKKQKDLEAELQAHENQRGKAVSTRNELIGKLNADIHEITTATTSAMSDLETNTRAERESLADGHENKMKQLEEKLEKLQEQRKKLVEDNAKYEWKARHEKTKISKDVKNIIQDYDEEMTKTFDDLTKAKHVHLTNQKKIKEYEEHFAAVEAERARKEAEEKRLNEIREKEEAEQRRIHNAAAKIQARFRGIQERKKFEERKAAGKGKKGKKGKGKKGKGKGKGKGKKKK